MKPMVEITNVNKYYGDNHVVKDVSFSIFDGEFLTMLGPSGCGKTTTLRMIAGFEEPTNGSILVGGENVSDKEPFERDVNTVFQSYALFPHKTIYDNIAFGLKMKKVKKEEIKERVTEMLSLVQLEGFEKRMPSQLSGGQKQRVAIARALINRPKVLLLDEPLGALDLKLRKQMQIELKRLQKKLGITFVYVTHDQEEALTMSDRIAVMNGGILEQLGTPDEIYEKPKSKFVADFIGESNVFEARVEEVQKGALSLRTETGTVTAKNDACVQNEIVYISVRPEKLQFSEKEVEGFHLTGVVKEHIYVGSFIRSIVVLQNGFEVKLNRLAGSDLPPVASVTNLYWEKEHAVVMHSRQHQIFSLIDNVDLGEHYETETAL
ncbi:MAG: spermidine/putrescine ABC transporter ATP-binding protein [Clostridiales bacterium 43-6]|nr:MAG: spermidine/putrescine ABC transporter ATP-binding protein [Clostridiales bacterium 43-6]